VVNANKVKIGASTGIINVQRSTLNAQPSTFYDLMGRRVSQPTKGLYITNGRKVVIK